MLCMKQTVKAVKTANLDAKQPYFAKMDYILFFLSLAKDNIHVSNRGAHGSKACYSEVWDVKRVLPIFCHQ